MIKTTIVETTEKYDKNGKLIEKIIREEKIEDDENGYQITTTPYTPYNPMITPIATYESN